MKIIPVILCGGSGTRLWPLSRKSYPKQFLSLVSENSLFQDTLYRAKCLTDEEAIVVTSDDYRFLAAEQITSAGAEPGAIILEPVQRNTAPAIAAAAIQALNQSHGEAPLLLVLPADHSIRDIDNFSSIVSDSIKSAEAGKLVTFGIKPTHPETGYGYIKTGKRLNSNGGYIVKQFIEKPSLDKAERFFESGDYYWNSGMFLFRADTYLDELALYSPDIKKACEESIKYANCDLDFIRLDSRAFKSSPDDSIDYAIMEKSSRVAMFPMEPEWSDVGSWDSLYSIRNKDNNGNAIYGEALLKETENCLVHSEKRMISTLGVKNLTIVETADAVLVADSSKVQNIKSLVSSLKESKKEIATSHKLTYRPWGKYDSVDNGNRFQVKRITVKPGEVLSLQKHFHRSEHWIVVSGVAEVTRDDEVFIVSENESAYIPRGAVHRLGNPGKIPLELIEVQSGSYLGEDDIVRLDDSYGRGNVSELRKTA